jgi:ketosteroid isomerase-like protein
MKSLLTCLMFSVLSFSAISQTKDEQAVVAAVEKLRAAMITGDRALLESIAADSLSYGHSGGKVEGKKDFVENIASGKSDFVTIDLSLQTLSVVNDVAIVRHTLNATTNDGGKPGVVKIHVLLVWHKYKGEWKLLARQAVKLM